MHVLAADLPASAAGAKRRLVQIAMVAPKQYEQLGAKLGLAANAAKAFEVAMAAAREAIERNAAHMVGADKL